MWKLVSECEPAEHKEPRPVPSRQHCRNGPLSPPAGTHKLMIPTQHDWSKLINKTNITYSKGKAPLRPDSDEKSLCRRVWRCARQLSRGHRYKYLSRQPKTANQSHWRESNELWLVVGQDATGVMIASLIKDRKQLVSSKLVRYLSLCRRHFDSPQRDQNCIRAPPILWPENAKFCIV